MSNPRFDENILQTIHSLEFAYEHLMDASGSSNAVESLLLMDVIELVVRAKQRTEAIQSAVACSEEGN